jgi:hypothetical protein
MKQNMWGGQVIQTIEGGCMLQSTQKIVIV